MNLSTITAEPTEAARKFEAYDQAVRQRHDDEMAAIRDSYAALAEGHELIDLHEAIAAGGLDEQGRPRLAIARADLQFINLFRRQVQLRPAQPWIDVFAFTTAPVRWKLDERRYAGGTVYVPAHRMEGTRLNNWRDSRAAVPVVPPDLIPRTRNGRLASLRHFHVLWEAEWEPIAPVDPVLLRHVGGSLYAVIAQWDLTPLERAVMARRFTS